MGAWVLLVALWAQADEAQDREVMLRMHERFAYATMMRTSLIHGSLDRALRHAGQLEATLDELAGDTIRERVDAAASAQTREGAAAAVARVAEACGSCHTENRVTVLVQTDGQVPWRDTVQARMGRHIWSADRMWAGLVGRNLRAWQEGAELLGSDPFFTTAGSPEVPADRLAALTALAGESVQATSWPERADAYGRFLGSCLDCHSALGK